MKIIANKKGYIKQSIEGNLDFMDDDKIRLRDVKIVNLESNFEGRKARPYIRRAAHRMVQEEHTSQGMGYDLRGQGLQGRGLPGNSRTAETQGPIERLQQQAEPHPHAQCQHLDDL